MLARVLSTKERVDPKYCYDFRNSFKTYYSRDTLSSSMVDSLQSPTSISPNRARIILSSVDTASSKVYVYEYLYCDISNCCLPCWIDKIAHRRRNDT